MKTKLGLLGFLLVASTLAFGQTTVGIKEKLRLQMPEGSGSNGASVAWHPVLKRYYAAFAGNADFPLGIFDEKGKRLSADNLTTQIDVRGLWYNENPGRIDGKDRKSVV